jgi:hypothetical protein
MDCFSYWPKETIGIRTKLNHPDWLKYLFMGINQKHASRYRPAQRPLMVFTLNPFKPATKVFNRKNDLVYGPKPRCRIECIPSKSTQMTSPRGVRSHFPQE